MEDFIKNKKYGFNKSINTIKINKNCNYIQYLLIILLEKDVMVI